VQDHFEDLCTVMGKYWPEKNPATVGIVSVS